MTPEPDNRSPSKFAPELGAVDTPTMFTNAKPESIAQGVIVPITTSCGPLANSDGLAVESLT